MIHPTGKEGDATRGNAVSQLHARPLRHLRFGGSLSLHKAASAVARASLFALDTAWHYFMGGHAGEVTEGGDATRYLITTLRSLGGVALCCLALTGCSADYDDDPGEACSSLAGGMICQEDRVQNRTIHNDPGGYIIDYALKIEQFRNSGEEIRILGRCDSACTLYLSLPRVCIGRHASFRFHAPYGARPSVNKLMQAYMLKAYPAWVREWIRAKGGLSGSYIVLRGKKLRKHLRRCA